MSIKLCGAASSIMGVAPSMMEITLHIPRMGTSLSSASMVRSLASQYSAKSWNFLATSRARPVPSESSSLEYTITLKPTASPREASLSYSLPRFIDPYSSAFSYEFEFPSGFLLLYGLQQQFRHGLPDSHEFERAYGLGVQPSLAIFHAEYDFP